MYICLCALFLYLTTEKLLCLFVGLRKTVQDKALVCAGFRFQFVSHDTDDILVIQSTWWNT